MVIAHYAGYMRKAYTRSFAAQTKNIRFLICLLITRVWFSGMTWPSQGQNGSSILPTRTQSHSK